MKKIFLLLISILFITGCENVMNTPTAKVENYLGKYQNLDTTVLQDLNTIIKRDESMSKKQKEEYKELMEKQYQNLSYKIKSEKIENNYATVETEIKVLDYKTAIDDMTKKYVKENEKIDIKKYLDKKIESMQKVKTKTKYEITFNLRKENDKWLIENVNDEDIEKLHGLF